MRRVTSDLRFLTLAAYPRWDVGLVYALLAATCGCGGPESGLSPAREVRELASPAGPDSGEANLTVAPGARVLLSWIEPAGEGVHHLRFAEHSRGGAWSEPRTVAEGADWFVNWADFPSLAALSDGTLFAHWLVKSGPGHYTYDVHMSISHDSGRTWNQAATPHVDGTMSEHGFVSMVPKDKDHMSVFWLDGRQTVDAAGQSLPYGQPGVEMALMHTTMDRDGRVGVNQMLDRRVCDCCQTGAAASARGPLVVYRDRSVDEVRDIAWVRPGEDGWSAPETLVGDGWQIAGCPVNGPAIDADGDRVAVAWFGAPDGKAHTSLVTSRDAGASWSAAARFDDGRPLGRVDVALLPGGGTLVSWMERVENGAEVRARHVKADGSFGQTLKIADSSGARASGFPRMVVADNEAVFAWRDTADPSRVRTAVVKLHSRR